MTQFRKRKGSKGQKAFPVDRYNQADDEITKLRKHKDEIEAHIESVLWFAGPAGSETANKLSQQSKRIDDEIDKLQRKLRA